MLRIHIAPAERRSGFRERSSSPPQYFALSPIQGLGEMLIHEIYTHAVYVAVPLARWREYAWQPPESRVDLSHAILQFRRHA